jgi:hypothetical protein
VDAVDLAVPVVLPEADAGAAGFTGVCAFAAAASAARDKRRVKRFIW